MLIRTIRAANMSDVANMIGAPNDKLLEVAHEMYEFDGKQSYFISLENFLYDVLDVAVDDDEGDAKELISVVKKDIPADVLIDIAH